MANEIDMCRNEQADRYENLDECIFRELVNTAFFDPRQLYDRRGRLKPLVDQPEYVRQAIADAQIRFRRSGEHDKDGRPVMFVEIKIKFKNKIKALRLLGNHLGMWNK